MTPIRDSIAAILLAAAATACSLGAASSRDSAVPIIETGDVDRFYRVYDAAGGRPPGDVLQSDYLDPGSDGLHALARMRNVTGASIAQAIAKKPDLYAKARACVAVLPRVRQRLGSALRALGRIHPEARFPPVTVVVGRSSPLGVGARDTGVQIGLEVLCTTGWINPDIEARFVTIAAHEYAHVQQAVAFSEQEGATVLAAALEEGAAEFVAELTTGSVAYTYMAAMVAGREAEIERAFAADMDKTDLSDWLYNSTPDTPGDLGYWVGYRIVQSYYRNADDKRQAIRDIFDMTDPKAFLAKSGWRPGLEPDDGAR